MPPLRIFWIEAISASIALLYESLGRSGGAAVAQASSHTPAARVAAPTARRNRVSTDFSLGAEGFGQVGGRDDVSAARRLGGYYYDPGCRVSRRGEASEGETRRRGESSKVLSPLLLVSPSPPLPSGRGGLHPPAPRPTLGQAPNPSRGSHEPSAAASHGPGRDADRRLARPPVPPRPRRREAPGPRPPPA